ncbi:hypothetical protein [Cellulomonas hominis]
MLQRADSRAGLGERVAPAVLDFQPEAASAWVHGAYALILDRTPDSDGLASFSDSLRRGLTPVSLLRTLRTSPEGREKRAQLPTDTHEALVWGGYLLALGRAPSRIEAAEALSALRNGLDDESFVAALCASQESRAALRFPPRGADRNEITARAIVSAAALPLDDATHQRLVRRLSEGGAVIDLVHDETARAARSWRGRLRARLLLHVIAANAHAIASAEVAAAEAAVTRELTWRVEMRRRAETAPIRPPRHQEIIWNG